MKSTVIAAATIWSLVSSYGSPSVSAVDSLVELPDSVPPFVSQLGPAPTAPPADTRVDLTVVLTPRNEADLEAEAAATNQPDHTALSPREFVNRYSPTQATFDQVRDYLVGRGLTITYEADDRLVISAQADRATADAAFYTTSRYGTFAGLTGFVNTTPLRVPSYLGSAITAVAGFNDFSRPTRFLRIKPIEGGGGRTAPVSAIHLPSSLRTAYNVDALGQDGSGTTVAIILDTPPTKSPSTSYIDWAHDYNLPVPNVTVIGTSSSATVLEGQQEADLDVESVAAVAPKTNIRFYVSTVFETGSLLAATSKAINDDVDVVTNSWGGCEAAYTGGEIAGFHAVYASAAARNITVLAASGDDGEFTCQNLFGTRIFGTTSYPAADSAVVAVGGTRVQLDPSTFAWTGETGWSCPSSSNTASCLNGPFGGSSGGGTATNVDKPAFQSNLTGSKRQVPDASTNADPQSGMAVRLGPGPTNTFLGGGTSAAAPWLAGAVDLAVQRKGGKIGNPNALLYAAPTTANGMFDVTVGFNGVNAKAGYDQVTGVGAVKDVAAFARALASGGSTVTTTSTVSTTANTTTVATTSTTASTTATTRLPTFTLAVTFAGSGNGSVTPVPAAISGPNCGPTVCTGTYAAGTVVQITPSAAAGSTFSGWSGDCSGTGACTVTMNSDRSVTVTFNPAAACTKGNKGRNPTVVEKKHKNTCTPSFAPPNGEPAWAPR